ELPLLCVSAATGEGLDALFNQVERTERSYRATLATPALNKALQAAIAAHQPPSRQGRALRFYYATQTATAPPELTIFTNAPGSVPPEYTRYLAGRFADTFGLVGIAVRIRYRPRRASDDVSGRPRRDTAPRRRRSSRPRSASARARRR